MTMKWAKTGLVLYRCKKEGKPKRFVDDTTAGDYTDSEQTLRVGEARSNNR